MVLSMDPEKGTPYTPLPYPRKHKDHTSEPFKEGKRPKAGPTEIGIIED